MYSLSDLLVSRLPRRPYCSDNLAQGLVIRSAEQALDKSYLQINPPVLRHWLVFDVDREYGAFAWEWANLPAPNWAAINLENGHAHLAYLLTTPVVTSAAGHEKPLRFAAAVEAGVCLSLKADPGYSGLITKNPLNRRWRTLEFHTESYSLHELAEWVKFPMRSTVLPEPNGLWRNVTIFESLRAWAYSWVLKYKAAGTPVELWFKAVFQQAEAMNSRFPDPLPASEIKATAKSVAKWVWRHFTEDAFREIQRARGRKSGEVRRVGSLEVSKPWEGLGISRRTYFNRKKAGLIEVSVALEPYQIPPGGNGCAGVGDASFSGSEGLYSEQPGAIS
jgi:hypothetical protein